MTLGLIWVVLPAAPRQGRGPTSFRADRRRASGRRRADARGRSSRPPDPGRTDHDPRQPSGSDRSRSPRSTVSSGRVRLRRNSSTGSRQKDGGEGALTLRLRLRNASTDAVFAPLDEAFLRDRATGRPDSFIETRRGDAIALFPLAVESEWSIVGQQFRDLKPGEVRKP